VKIDLALLYVALTLKDAFEHAWVIQLKFELQYIIFTGTFFSSVEISD